MSKKYAALHALLEDDPQAKTYFDSLPGYVQEQMKARSGNINSFASLQDYAQNLTRGDR